MKIKLYSYYFEMVLSSFSKRTTFTTCTVYLLVIYKRSLTLWTLNHDLSNSMHFIANILYYELNNEWGLKFSLKSRLICFFVKRHGSCLRTCYKHNTSRCFEDIFRDLSIHVFKRFLKYWTVKNDLGHREVGKRSLWRMLQTVGKKHPTAW